MKHVDWAYAVSLQSLGSVLMSEFSLPDYQHNLDGIVDMFDEDDRFGMWAVSVRDNRANISETKVIAVLFGEHDDVLKAALCLHPVAELYHEHRQRLPGYVHLTWAPTNFESPSLPLHSEREFLSFPDFVATRRENVTDANSNWTDDDRDDEDHVKGFFYGPENLRILITECEHTDMVAVAYQDWAYREENQTEIEALAYRCYLHSLNVLDDNELRVFFPAPFRTRRTSLTY